MWILKIMRKEVEQLASAIIKQGHDTETGCVFWLVQFLNTVSFKIYSWLVKTSLKYIGWVYILRMIIKDT